MVNGPPVFLMVSVFPLETVRFFRPPAIVSGVLVVCRRVPDCGAEIALPYVTPLAPLLPISMMPPAPLIVSGEGDYSTGFTPLSPRIVK